MLPPRQIKNLNVGAGSNAPSSSRLQAISVQIDSHLFRFKLILTRSPLPNAFCSHWRLVTTTITNGRMKISTGSSQAGSEQMEQRNKENYPRHQALHSENTENTEHCVLCCRGVVRMIEHFVLHGLALGSHCRPWLWYTARYWQCSLCCYTSTSNLKETAAPSDGPISWSWAIRIQGDSGDSASP